MQNLNLLASVTAPPHANVLGQQVVDQMRVLIITGQIPAETHLVEAQLSTMFGVSRGPIRDALTILEAEGLVENRRRGCFVVGLTSRDIDELYSVREAIELTALRIAADAPTEAWGQILEPLEAMRAAAQSGDHLEFAHADMAFHASFYSIADHHRLQRIWQQYEPTFSVLLELTTAEDIDLGPSYESHVEIHTQMMSGKLDEAALSLKEHLLGSRTRLISAFSRLSADGTLSDTDKKEK
jgi:GntR family transcriptional regulator of gluconate operon